jgi:uncharacterized membrane protein YgcG/DNA-directed RNA polymerase subunit RPC12/RpoP
MSVLQYKCPNCAGAISFDSGLQLMKCPYCDAEFDVAALKQMDEQLSRSAESAYDWDITSGTWREGEQEGLGVFSCQSCGGEIVADENLGASSCPYCDSPVVLSSRFSGELRPDLVVPFSLDKDAAKAALNRHYKGKRLLPKVFKSNNHIDEITGMYVPFWLFSADVNADIHYQATKTRVWSSRDYRYTETSHFDVFRSGGIAFDAIPEDGASKIDDDMMESIEPFDLRGAVDFQTAYLAGYIADKYDVDAQTSIARANVRIHNSTEEAFRSTVNGFGSVSSTGSRIQLYNAAVRYALLPVWFLSTSWEGKRYYFAMNGQTGKLAGDLPMDKKLFTKWLFGLFAIIAVVLSLIMLPMTIYAAEPETVPYEEASASSSGNPESVSEKEASSRQLARLVDAADLLTAEQEADLLPELDRISELYRCDVVIAAVPAMEEYVYGTDYADWTDTQDYADSFFWFNTYGYGTNRDGILLLLAMEDRDYAFSTHGFGMTAFTYTGIESIERSVLPYLKDDQYNEAFKRFASYADSFLKTARDEKSYENNTSGNSGTTYSDRGTPYRVPIDEDILIIFVFIIAVSFFVALMIVLFWKSRLKSVRTAHFAREYVRPNSMVLVNGYERFLYKTTQATRIERDNGSSGGGGGGSHTSSFGVTFGGKSGKF